MATTFEITNIDKLNELLSQYPHEVQNKAVYSTMTAYGRKIINSTKSNFYSIAKGKSKTNYADLNKALKISKMKSKFGVKIGLQHREGYKYRFIEHGTKDRQYVKNGKIHKTGRIIGSLYFTKAVETHKVKGIEDLQDTLIKQLEKISRKYNKNL
jgi:hypothetical protein